MAKSLNEAMNVPASFTAKVRGVEFKIDDIQSLPVQSLAKIFEYGLQRISNDSAASAKTDEEAIQLATKRWDNLRAGVIRAAGTRIGDPVKRRANELAMNAVANAPKFKAWLATAQLKTSDKTAIAQQKAQAAKHIESFMAQAKIDVEGAKALPTLDLDDIEI